MKLHILSPGDALVVLFLVFVCVPAVVTQGTKTQPAPKTPKRTGQGNANSACTEGVANLVGPTVSGTIRFLKQGASDTKVQIEVKGLKRGESSNFHIHEKPAGSDGRDCKAALDHFGVNGKKICKGRVRDQSTCQIGDLSGKSEPLSVRGNGQATVSYVDHVIDISKIIGLGVVVHEGNTKNTIACGNIFCKKK
ncbi:hypothetical protein PGT21_016692 [Puccinia graminis f. sp. tritici]|uniref:Copper/zinc superoxide dismutase n=2 Tax=Puccinia graminis f. sp. tritici TaxID=56615 RepID=E3K080_PUCGT|nr:copper/zinc superoxide dismutase [Puccinia graminis f. sp. tritici CRL 75-36-700-3]EFP77705.2 copper/zinc superoxide dismutase [Puccinia graminis f. sp. tritici CRL 75-36-700-3]KAA1110279.1 hypothetical protein PGT21_016692 [Puccinia graminis f. sp. tritici]KAA1128639.1 hypothetical protein PGTUg99_018313 [Puccinia graminis f. sp. tritici]